MASFVYNAGTHNIVSGAYGWTSATVKARLVPTSGTLNKDDTDCSTYTTIGTDQTLGSKTIVKDTTNDQVKFTAADPTWTAVAAGWTIGWCVVYFDDGGNGIPIVAHDVTDTPTNGGNITIDFPTVNSTADTVFYIVQ